MEYSSNFIHPRNHKGYVNCQFFIVGHDRSRYSESQMQDLIANCSFYYYFQLNIFEPGYLPNNSKIENIDLMSNFVNVTVGSVVMFSSDDSGGSEERFHLCNVRDRLTV